jgi:hypothetical protein
MARPSQQKFRLMKVFKRAMANLAGSYTLTDTTLADGSPAVLIASGGTTFGLAAIQQKSYSGFNIVGDISTSAGEGNPEHNFKLHFKSNASPATIDATSLVSILAARTGCAACQIYLSTNTPAEAELTDANLKQTIAVSSEMGQIGA